MCLMYEIAATWNPSAEVFEQFELLFTHDSNIFRSQLGRNMVVSPVWLALYHMKSQPRFTDDNIQRVSFALNESMI